MQQHVYNTTKTKIFRQSFFIWLYVLTQVAINIYLVFFYVNAQKVAVILVSNLALSFITVPGIFIFLNYYKYSINKEFIVNNNSIKLIDKKTKNVTEIKDKEIEKIEVIEMPKGIYSLRSPYGNYRYFRFTGKDQKRIIVPFYIMSYSDFLFDAWFEILVYKTKAKKITTVEKFYPLIEINKPDE